MGTPPDRTSDKPGKANEPPSTTDAREARLADALRANLRRRKAAPKSDKKG